MAKRQSKNRGILLEFLLLLPILDIPPRPPGETGNIYEIWLKRRKRRQEGFASESKLQNGLRLVPQKQPDETSTGSEDDLGNYDEE